jgi:putative flippase GtrA
MKIRFRVKRVLTWSVLGVTASGVEYGLLYLLSEWLHWPLPLASIVAAEALILVKFLVADRWVFGHPLPAWDRLLKYHGASAGALIVYWVAFNALAVLLSLPVAIAFVAGTGAAFAWSLMSNFLWVWAA